MKNLIIIRLNKPYVLFQQVSLLLLFGLFAQSTSLAQLPVNTQYGLDGPTFPLSDNFNGNTIYGQSAMNQASSSTLNTAIGLEALKIGGTSLQNYYSVAIGAYCMRDDQHLGSVGIGNSAMKRGTSWRSVAIGSYTMDQHDGGFCIGIGSYVFESMNVHTRYTIGIGDKTGYKKKSGYNCTYIGDDAARLDTSAYANTGVGYDVLYNIQSSYNTAIGGLSGTKITSGLGGNTFVGHNANASTENSSHTNSTAIGNSASITASNQIRLGNSSVQSIGGYTGWTILSDARYKKDVQENVAGLDFVLRLRPVTYHVKALELSQHLGENVYLHTEKNEEGETAEWITQYSDAQLEAIKEKENKLQTGFIAQEVEAIAQEIGYDFSGIDQPKSDADFYGLRYDEFVVPLVKAVQEQQAIILALEERLAALETRMATQESSPASEGDIQIQVSPNPFSNGLSVDFSLEERPTATFFELFDTKGRLISSKKIDTQNGSFEMQKLDVAQGIYFWQLRNDTAILKSGKVVKQ